MALHEIAGITGGRGVNVHGAGCERYARHCEKHNLFHLFSVFSDCFTRCRLCWSLNWVSHWLGMMPGRCRSRRRRLCSKCPVG